MSESNPPKRRRLLRKSAPAAANTLQMSESNPEDQKIKYTMVISDDNKIFGLCHNTKTITCCGESDSHYSYRASHSNSAKAYLFANVDEHGETVIVYKDGQGEEKNYSWKEFFDKANMDGLKTQMNVDHHISEGIIKCTLEGGPLVEIKRTTHVIRSLGLDWELICPIFEVADKSIRVRNALSLKSFFNLCLRYKDFKTQGVSLMDLNVHKLRDEIQLLPVSPNLQVSNGLVRGLYCENPTSVFVLRNSRNVSQRYEYLRKLSTSPHENIQAFFGMKKEGDNYLLAFEPVGDTLADYLLSVEVRRCRSQFLHVLRGIIEGLKQIHKLGLFHGDINPWNTYVKDGTFKFGGYNDWKFLTSSSRNSDIDGVAKLIAYIFSFYDLLDREKDKHKYSKLSLSQFQSKMHPYAREAYNVVELLSAKIRSADLLDRILLEMWLWTADRRMMYFKEIQEILYDKYRRQGYLVNKAALQSKLSTCWDSKNAKGWSDCFSPVLMAEKNKFDKAQGKFEYDTWKVKELVRFVRNLYSHHFEFGGEMEKIHKFADLGESIEDLELLIRSRFPELLVGLHREIKYQNLHSQEKLKRFYEKDG